MQSTHLDLPYLQAAQAQKHVTVNEALRRLDACVQLSVVTRTRSSPPQDARDGSRFLVREPGEEEWEGKGGRIAARQDGAWAFLTPRTGWLAFVEDEGALLVNDGREWRAVGGAGPETADRFGVNVRPEEPNRFAVRSHASLFDHEGAGHRVAINRANRRETASLLFQEGYSGRAELGLAGENGFALRASSDGVQWHDALRVDAETARPRFPQGAGGVAVPIMGNSGSSVAGGQTRFLTPGLNGASAAEVYVPVPMAGRFTGLVCVTGDAPGPGQSWRFTLQKLFGDTALACTIGAGVNQGADLENGVHFAAQQRWSIKMVASAGAAPSGNVLFSMLFVPD